MSNPFRQLGPAKRSPLKVNGHAKNWTEAEVIAITRRLMQEFVEARQAAIDAENVVCGNCKGSGQVPSTLMPGETLNCFACEGSGKPNDKVQSVPALTAEDNERLWKLGRLLRGPYGASLIPIVREFAPDLYPTTGTDEAIN